MKLKVYNFDKKEGKLGDISFKVTDYFQYYHTGIENIINKDMLLITERYDNERSEVLAYNFLQHENQADLLLALNNDVLLWDSPYDNNMYETLIDIYYNYIRKVNKTIPDRFEDEKFREVSRDQVDQDDSILRSVIIPKEEFIQKIMRIIDDYLKSREVK